MKKANVQEVKTLRSGPAPGESDLPKVPEPAARGKEPVSKVRKHSKISPSRLKDLEICPSKQEDPNAEPHPITIQGTRCHDALDKGNWKNLEDPEDVYLCSIAHEFTESIIAKYRKNTGENPLVLTEVKLELPHGLWGYADRIIMPAKLSNRGVADLIDYKFATQLQEDAETNPQAQAYVIGVFRKFKTVDVVFVTFFYPRLGKVSQAVYNRSDLLGLELRLTTVVDRVKRGGIFLPHPDVCTYCLLQGTCEANLKKVLPLAKRYDEGHDKVLPAVPDFSLIKSPEKWATLLAYAPVLENTAASIKRHAVEFRVDTGQEIPGFTLSERAGRAKIHSPILAKEIAAKYGVTDKEFLSAVEIAVGKLLDAAAEHAPRGKKEATKMQLERELADTGILERGLPSSFMRKDKQQ